MERVLVIMRFFVLYQMIYSSMVITMDVLFLLMIVASLPELFVFSFFFFFQAEDGIRDQPRSRGLGDVYKRQV